MVGRDIGTVVLPRATLKVFLTATAAVRAAQRASEMGRQDRFERYLHEIEEGMPPTRNGRWRRCAKRTMRW